MFVKINATWLGVAAACILLAGCSRNPQAAKQKYMDQGHSYSAGNPVRLGGRGQ